MSDNGKFTMMLTVAVDVSYDSEDTFEVKLSDDYEIRNKDVIFTELSAEQDAAVIERIAEDIENFGSTEDDPDEGD